MSFKNRSMFVVNIWLIISKYFIKLTGFSVNHLLESLSQIECHNRIKPYIHNTPVITSTQINNMTGAEIYFKCDNFQKMGALKMRGATNAILQLPENKH